MKDPSCYTSEKDRFHAIFIRTSELMAEYQIAVDCRDEQTRRNYIAQGYTTQEWLDEYWAAMEVKHEA